MEFVFRKGSLLSLVFERAALMKKPNLLLTTFHFPERASIQLKRHIDVFGDIDIWFHKSHRQDYNMIKSFEPFSQVHFHVLKNHSKMAFLQADSEIVCFLSSNNLVNGCQYEFFLTVEGAEAKEMFDAVVKELEKFG